MVYALNVFNFLKGKENDYREYSVKAGKTISAKIKAGVVLNYSEEKRNNPFS